jgi:hypothetical protein
MDNSGIDTPGVAGGAGGQPGLDLASLSEALIPLIDQAVNEHMQWTQGFFQWCNAQLTNFLPVPPQADMDFINRQNWIIGYVKRFEPAAGMLARAGERSLADAVARQSATMTKMLVDFNASKSSMAAGDAATQANIRGINDKMAADNLAAGAARMKMQKDSFTETFEMNNKAMADQRASFGRMNQNFIDNIDN